MTLEAEAPLYLLVIEDSRSIAGLVAGRVEKELGLRSLVAASRADAQAQLAAHGASIVAGVVDLDLPDALHGEALGDVAGQGIPALVLTGSIEDELRDRLMSAGACDYVMKDAPDAIDAVLRSIRRIERNRWTGVLVVDDAPSARAYLIHLLERWGFRCHEAGGGEEALRRVADEELPIHLVLCDHNMPGMDGATLIRELRRCYPLQRLGIIGLSSYGSGLLSARLLKAGADDFLTRPFLEEEFSVRVNQSVDLLQLLHEAEEGARRDALTGLRNRRYLEEVAVPLAETAQRTGQALVALVVDLDHFKEVNDQLGHFAGDEVLKAVAGYLQRTVRSADILVRSGGEEFYIIGLSNDQEGIEGLAERLRGGIEELEVAHEGKPIPVTASIGLASTRQGTVENALKAADRAMYLAKQEGRNRVINAADRRTGPGWAD